MPSKRSFRDALKKGLAMRGMTLADAAAELHVPGSSLRSWVATNRFPSEALEVLGRLAGLGEDAEDLASRFEFELRQAHGSTKSLEPHSMGELLELLDRRSGRGAGAAEDLARENELFLDQLGAGDVRVHSSLDALPAELDDPHWPWIGRAYTEALSRGAHFAYLYPDASAVERLRACGLTLASADAWSGLLDRLRRNARRELEALGVNRPELCVEAQIHEVALDELAYCAPGHAYSLLKYFDESADRFEFRWLALVPARPHPNHVLLDETAGRQLQSVVMRALESALPELADVLQRRRPPEERFASRGEHEDARPGLRLQTGGRLAGES